MEKFAHELNPGDECAPLEITVSPELNEQFLFAQQDFHPRYLSSPDGSQGYVHPTFLLQMSANTKSPSFRLAPGMGSILAESATEFRHPVAVGTRVRIEWKVVEVYEKRGRRYQVMRARVLDSEGVEVLRRDLHLTFLGRPSAA